MRKIVILQIFLLVTSLCIGQDIELTQLEETVAISSDNTKNPVLAIDQSTSSFWASKSFVDRDTKAWIEIGFPAQYKLKKIMINWKVPATSYELLYLDSTKTWRTIEFARNKNKYGENVINRFETDVQTSKIRINMLNRIMISVYTGGDLFDNEPIGYEINEIEVIGEAVKNEDNIN